MRQIFLCSKCSICCVSTSSLIRKVEQWSKLLHGRCAEIFNHDLLFEKSSPRPILLTAILYPLLKDLCKIPLIPKK